jgi:hypothetical protein
MNVLDRIEALSDDLKLYFNTNVELVKLQALDRSSTVGARIVSNLIIGVVVLLFVIFASIAAAIYLSILLEAYYLGFGIVAGFYLLVGLILLASRKQSLENPIRDAIIRNAMDNEATNKQS